jgi:murein L,D-transpeptidase YafK
MITAKEKALEIANKFYRGSVFDKTKEEHLAELKEAKQSALTSVDEILKVAFFATDEIYNHYLEVKQELDKLEIIPSIQSK